VFLLPFGLSETYKKHTGFLAVAQLGILEWNRSTKPFIAKEVPWTIESAQPSIEKELIPE
jgi:hypothetical protein